MSLPTISTNGSFTTIVNGKTTLWFSYSTLIGFAVNGQRFVQENQWGNTTGKHLNAIDGGNKKLRVSAEEFERKYNELMS